MHAVILHASTPPEFRALIGDLLHQKGERSFFFALECVPAGFFLECHVVKDKTDSNPWKIQIPPGYVLAIADMRGDKHPLGFLT